MPGSRWIGLVGRRRGIFGMRRLICGYRLVKNVCATPGATPPALEDSTGGTIVCMRRDEVVAALRQAQKDRKEISRMQARLAAFEKAWRSLTREEQEILHRTVVDNRKGQVEWLCGELGIEKSAVYRRRDKALQKLGERL